MLPRPLRVTARADHRSVARRGRRASAGPLTVHLLAAGTGAAAPVGIAPGVATAADRSATPARAGLVVGRAVGGSVVRHRVSRRLRHLLADRMAGLPAGSRLVVRAGAGSDVTSAELAADLDRALARVTQSHSRTGARPGRAAR